MKKIGIMQPYFLPYIGYFQLMDMVDEFVLYDTIQFTKKGWIPRNRMLQNNKDCFFTLPLRKDSDFLNINERYLADSYNADKDKLLRKIENNYSKAPYFTSFYPVVEEVLNNKSRNLFDFVYNSLNIIKGLLHISTPIVRSSELDKNIELIKGQEKVLAICNELQATHYINPIGGTALYNKKDFRENNIELNFLQSNDIVYPQFSGEFVQWLSILDVLMFNSVEQTRGYLDKYRLL